jgi:DNA-directed RNA polymerase subunit beta
MKQSFTFSHNIRKSFGKIPDLVDMPNLLEIQKNSYELFLQKDVKPEDREDIGLQAVFNKVFPITDFSGVAELRFIKYELEEPKYDVEECIQRGGTYGSLLKVTLNLIIREIDEETGITSVKDIKEQDVYLTELQESLFLKCIDHLEFFLTMTKVKVMQPENFCLPLD